MVAVRGNVDEGEWAMQLPLTQVTEVDRTTLYVLHDLQKLDLDPLAAGFQVVVSGHTHQPHQTKRAGVLFVNPGSAGPRRFQLPITLARLDLGKTPWKLEFVDLSKGA